MIATRPEERRRPEKSGTTSVREEVAELISLDLEVGAVLVVGIGEKGNPLDDLETISLEPDELARVIRHHAYRGEPQIPEDLRSDAVVAEVGSKAQALVGLHRVRPIILERIRPDFVEQADPASLLIEVDDSPLPLLRNQLHGSMQLKAAIAAAR